MKPVFRLAVSTLTIGMLSACYGGGGGGGTKAPTAKPSAGGKNELAVGENAVVKEPLEIPFTGTMDLNYKTKDEITNMRKNMALRGSNSQLLKGDYQASSAIFDSIASEKTWVGLKGRTFTNAGKPTDGQAEQSRFICSPFMLVAADFKIPADNYDTSRYNYQTFVTSQFPLQCPPKTILFDAPNASEEIVFDVSAYRNSANNYLKPPANLENVDISLIAYNARDFGYKWMGTLPGTENVDHTPRIPPQPWELKQYLAFYTDNYMAGDTEEMSRWKVTRVPAKMVFGLWKAKPASAADKPDLTVTIKLI